MRTLLGTIIAVLLAACGPPDTHIPLDQAPPQLKSAQTYQQKGQFKAALIEAQNAVRRAPEQMAPHLQIISLYNTLGYFRSAIDAAAIAPAQSDPTLLLEKARALNGLKKYRSAKNLLQDSNFPLEDQQQPFFHLYLGQALAGLGEMENARLTLQKAVQGPSRDSAIVELARIDLLEGKSNSAIATLEPLLDSKTPSSAARLLAAEIAIQRGKYSRAEDYLTDALSQLPVTDIMLPERIDTLQLMRRALTLHGRIEEAMLYDRVLNEELPDYSANKRLIEQSIGLIEDNQLDKASEILTQALENGGDSFAGTLLGIVNYLQGNLSQAADMLTAHIDPETANSAALELLLSAKFQLNEIDQVLDILESELQTRRGSANLLGLYGLAKLARQDLTGIGYIEQSLELDPSNNRLRLAMLTFYRRQGLLPQALEQARQAYRSNPVDPAAQEALIQLLISSDKTVETIALATDIASNSPNDSYALTLAGIAYLMADDAPSATKHLQRAVEIAPDNARAWMALARLAYSEQQYDTAETYFRNVIDIVPSSIDALKGIISSNEAQHDVARGLAILQRFTDDNPQNGLALAVTAQYQLRNQRLQPAIAAIEQALQRQENSPYIENVALDAYRQLAEQSLADNKYALARKQLSQGLAQLPNSIPLLALLATTEVRDGNPVAANEVVELLLQLAPAKGYEVLGDIQDRQDHAKALAAYLEAWNIQPSPVIAGKIYGLLRTSDPAEAEAFTKDWATQLPGDNELLLVKAIQAQNSPNPESAIRLYQQLLEADPENATALNNLAWLYLSQADSGDKALQLARMAQQIRPGDPAILDTLGMVLLSQGDTEQGIRRLEQALQLAPDSAEIKQHLQQAQNR
jgi:tetratricopeptide (TPR) repeat protein